MSGSLLINDTTVHPNVGPSWVASHAEEPWFDAIPGEILRVRVRSLDVGGRYAVLESIAQPMAGAPLHTHREDEVFHVLDGVLTFQVAGARVEAQPGWIVVVPAGVEHAWRNFGVEPTRCLMTFTPGGIETLFETLRHVPPEELASLAAQYGSVVTGPPLEP